jgi:carboxymethylenebutenolidase
MCYGPTARPPLPPIRGGAGVATSGKITLEAADGNRLMAFAATTSDPDAPGIVILPDVRGLHPFFEELATRFAEAGVHATAIDYFGRTAGVGARGAGFEHRPHVEQTTTEGIRLDAAAASAHVASDAGGGAGTVYSVGFCMGGRHSFNLAATDVAVAGVIGFYGFPAPHGAGDTDAPVDLAKDYRAPVLGLFGGADPSISATDVASFRDALDRAGVANEIVTYERAPHSFFDRAFADFEDECADAWERMLRFVGR